MIDVCSPGTIFLKGRIIKDTDSLTGTGVTLKLETLSIFGLNKHLFHDSRHWNEHDVSTATCKSSSGDGVDDCEKGFLYAFCRSVICFIIGWPKGSLIGWFSHSAIGSISAFR